MARWSPEQTEVVQAIAAEILHHYRHGRTMVAVDGRHCAGQGEIADALAAELTTRGAKVFRASMRDFFRPRADRERAEQSGGAAYYREVYDYSLVRRVLVDPFHTAGSTGFVLTGFDAVRDQPVFQPKWMSAGADAILVIDGVFLHRRELAGLWNYSIWLATPPREVPEAPHAEPADDSEGAGERAAVYRAADERYQAEASPSEKATTIIDNRDPERPRRVFADSC